MMTWSLTVGIGQMQQGLDTMHAMGMRMGQPFFLSLLAAAYGDGGEPAKGLESLAEASVAVIHTAEQSHEAELYRLRGHLVQQSRRQHPASDVQREVAVCFQQALDLSRRQEAKSLELRAATSLARLWQQQGQRDDARELLRPIYGWFTEGFDTAALQEAKALLEELSP